MRRIRDGESIVAVPLVRAQSGIEGSIGGVSARLPPASQRSPLRRTPGAPPSFDTGLIMGAAPNLSTTFTLTFAPTLLGCSAYGSYDRRLHLDRADFRRGDSRAHRSRAGVEASAVLVLVERADREKRRPSTRLRAPRATSRGGASAGKKQRRFGLRCHDAHAGGWNNMATASVGHEAGHSPYGYSLSMS